MGVIDISTPIAIMGALLITVLLIFLSKELKNSAIIAVVLGVFVALLIVHSFQLVTITNATATIARCLTVDYIFILLTYISYLWIDDIETKFKNKKSIDNSLDWFWKKV